MAHLGHQAVDRPGAVAVLVAGQGELPGDGPGERLGLVDAVLDAVDGGPLALGADGVPLGPLGSLGTWSTAITAGPRAAQRLGTRRYQRATSSSSFCLSPCRAIASPTESITTAAASWAVMMPSTMSSASG